MNCKTHQDKDSQRPWAKGGISAQGRASRPEYSGKNEARQSAAERDQIKG